jgi:hypothetical protein
MTKLCKNCKHYRKDVWRHFFLGTDSYDTCVRPNNRNYVTQKSQYNSCEFERSLKGYCGITAKYYEPKEQ